MSIYQTLGAIRVFSYLTAMIVLIGIAWTIWSAVKKRPELLTGNIKAFLMLLIGTIIHFVTSSVMVMTNWLVLTNPTTRIVIQIVVTIGVVVIIPTIFYVWYALHSESEDNQIHQ